VYDAAVMPDEKNVPHILDPEGAPESAGAADPDEKSRLYDRVPEMVRKAVITGLGALFMTEEGVRALVKELKLPKEIVGFITSQADRTKTEVTRIIGDEIRRFFESAQLRQEFVKLLSTMTIEIRADVRLRPDGEHAVEPEIKLHEAKVRRSSRP
jgi:hypothetical protein